jgi:hypothetical protein
VLHASVLFFQHSGENLLRTTRGSDEMRKVLKSLKSANLMGSDRSSKI